MPQKTFLITTGPTVEPIDPVRYISNYSTGEMGYALAKAAKNKGHKVILVSGPTRLEPPRGVKFIPVKTAREMRKAVLGAFGRADCIIMAAAVADFRPAAFSGKKLKKGAKKKYLLKLVRNPDILSELGREKGRKIIVGYSLETDNHIKNAKKKMKLKNMDMVVVNTVPVRRGGIDPFGPGNKDFTVILQKGAVFTLKGLSKQKISGILLDKINTLW